MDDVKPTILIVEDDLDIAEMLTTYFSVQGYAVQAANWGEDAVTACQEILPDLVILDIRLPDIDGFEVARRLRSTRKTRDIPFIFLTEKRERSDRLKGLALQADDYITKPFDIQELRLRVRNALLRASHARLNNPITGMPEGRLVDEALAAGLERPETTMIVISLKNINRFREVYGFVASDDLLRAVGMMVHDALHESACEDFVGHLGQADFLVISRQDYAPAVCERIRTRLEQSFNYFYSDRDREQGTFRNTQLGVTINELVPSMLEKRDLPHLRAELEQFCH